MRQARPYYHPPVFKLVAGLCLVALAGCSDPEIRPVDAGVSDGGGANAPRIPWLASGAPPIANSCPTGWHEGNTESGVPTCAPFSEDGAATCGNGEAHLPGGDGCAPIGSPCPVGDWSEVLPADRPIVYVRAGAAGGDGSMARPWASPSDFSFGGLSRGTVVALAAGSYEAEVHLPDGISLWGTCAARTQLSSVSPHEMEGVVSVLGVDAEMRDLSIGPSPRPGIWAVGEGLTAHLAGVEVRAVEFVGLAAVGDVRLTAEQLVVRDMVSRARDLEQGRAMTAQAGATVDIRGASIERTRDVAVFAGDDETRLLLEDVAIRETRERERDRAAGRAVAIQGGAGTVLRRVLLEDNRDIALFAQDEGSSAVLEDVVIENTMARASDGDFGRGVAVQRGATAEIRRSRVGGSRDLGVFVGTASLVLEDVLIADTLGDEGDGSGGRGLNMQDAATAELRRVIFERNREVAVHVADPGSVMTAEDVVVRDTESRLSSGFGGRGLSVESGATGTVTRGLVEGCREAGVLSGGDGAAFTLSDLVVRDTSAPECSFVGCVNGSAGLAAVHRGALTAERFVVSRSEVCGVLIARGGSLDLLHGEVRESLIGACIQVDGYDINRLSEHVAYRDNGTNLETTDLPVPEPVDPISP